jgi:uncharacterized protein YoxC
VSGESQILLLSTVTDKLDSDMIALISDLIIVIVLIIGFNVIQKMQKNYIKAFKKLQVDVRDFTLEIENLP